MAKQEKVDKVNELKEIFKNSYGLIFTFMLEINLLFSFS